MSKLSKVVMLAGFLLSGPTVFAAEQRNICPDEAVPCCRHIGKIAYNNEETPPPLQGIKIGKIVGVLSKPRPSAQPSEAPKDHDVPYYAEMYVQYFYIIDDGKLLSLRDCAEIDPRSPD